MITTRELNGRLLAPLAELLPWESNPRSIEDKDFQRLLRQICDLGQYKPLLVTEEGKIAGGNRRFDAYSFLNTNVYSYTNSAGEQITIDKTSTFTEVWVSKIAFDVNPETQEITVILNGERQTRTFKDIQQVITEYAVSDNDPAGQWDALALANLLHPYQGDMPLDNYSFILGQPVPGQMLLDSFQPSNSATDQLLGGHDLGGGTDTQDTNSATDSTDTNVLNKEVTASSLQDGLNAECPRCHFQFKFEERKVAIADQIIRDGGITLETQKELEDLTASLQQTAQTEAEAITAAEPNGAVIHDDIPPSPEAAGLTTEQANEVPVLTSVPSDPEVLINTSTPQTEVQNTEQTVNATTTQI
jgi:hypothetical protein